MTLLPDLFDGLLSDARDRLVSLPAVERPQLAPVWAAPIARRPERPRPHPAADTEAALSFITATESKPVFHSSAYTGGAPRLFFDTERHLVPVRDLRPLAGGLSLDQEGFELHRSPSTVADLHDEAAVEALYLPEVEALLCRLTGAARVVAFDATRRTDGPGFVEGGVGKRGPARQVHVDYTRASGPRRAADVLGTAEVERWLAAGGRIAQINLWRPIRGPVERSPLALADAASVRPAALVATDQVFPDRVGEIYHLAYEPTQRWYWAPRMTPEEVLLIKGWDSRDDGRARFTPHSAFDLPATPPEAAPRESIEVRTFALFAR
ncbi:MAG: CmcJ/NvfI family oxidoreductase [Tistlia sp.]|uniref:CmcJ/NvfI family oxidoreductase n=1 Tax=Tistlia sp. TaxID=3057121 RepID=UPI0034A38D91